MASGENQQHRSMRRITTTSTVGKVNIPAPLSKEFALLAVLLAAIAWVGYAFMQEVFLNHRLNAQAAEIRQQNTIMAAQNDGYRRELMLSTAGAAADEDARQHGYARPDERVYVVGRPTAQAGATDAMTGSTNRKATQVSAAKVTIEGNNGNGVWRSLGRWISNFWHR